MLWSTRRKCIRRLRKRPDGLGCGRPVPPLIESYRSESLCDARARCKASTKGMFSSSIITEDPDYRSFTTRNTVSIVITYYLGQNTLLLRTVPLVLWGSVLLSCWRLRIAEESGKVARCCDWQHCPALHPRDARQRAISVL
eukprot:5728147-Amphidinium_carterae.1